MVNRLGLASLKFHALGTYNRACFNDDSRDELDLRVNSFDITIIAAIYYDYYYYY